MAQLKQLTRSDGVGAILEALAVDGAVIVTDWVATDLLERFRGDIADHAGGHRAGTLSNDPMVQRFWGANTKRFTRLAHRSTAFIDILTDPMYLAVADALLLPHAPDYWMNTGQMMIIGPGERSQWLHRDADNWPTMNRANGFEVTVSCMYAISEFTAEVGATRVVPGSHLWDDYQRKAALEEIAQAVMPAGAGMIYTGRVLHGAGANVTTDQWRFGMHLSYVLGWLTPEEASPLGADWDTVKHLPAAAQRLLGWRSSPGRNDAARLWTVDYEDVPSGLGLES
jgi:ectoine hydroxylase-related dioxygenase (phytanoyl-CoA dioxygenase family)